MDLINLQNILSKHYRIHILLKTCGTFSKIDHIKRHIVSISKYRVTEIISCILSDHNGIKLQINSKRNYKTYTKSWVLKNMLLNDKWNLKEIVKET